jgi:flavin reductase (DIM6/NTAB) family NADH-FMN oxidoreductase RutF
VTVTPHKFRDALGRFATGVTVVTTLAADNHPIGVTVNAFASLSLEPPLILISLAQTTAHLRAYLENDQFAVNMLGEDQRNLSVAFSNPHNHCFEGLDFTTWESGCPLLDGCLANLECTRTAVHEGGDHYIVVGHVDRLRHVDKGDPLIFFRGEYSRIGDSV